MPIPNVLILGQEGNTVEQEAMDLLSKNQRSECKLESKRDKNRSTVMEEAKRANFIVMCYHDNPEEDKNTDSALLAQLGEHQDQLMLIADNREELMDLLDNLDIQAFRSFKSSSGNRWQTQLLGEVTNWVRKQSQENETEKGSVFERTLEYLTQTDKLLKVTASVLIGITPIAAYLITVFSD